MRAHIERFFIFFIMQQKRLFSRPAFISLLALIILMSGAFALVSAEDDSIIRVGLASRDGDVNASAVMEVLSADEDIITFSRVDVNEGERLVTEGELEAVWIFEEGFTAKLDKLASGGSAHPPITVITGEDGTVNALSREKLYSTVFPLVSRRLYEQFAEKELGLSGDRSLVVLDQMSRNESIVTFRTLDAPEETVEVGYLVTPLRGLLALCILLCSFACVMYALKDVAEGVYGALSLRSRFIPIATGVLAGALDAGVAACMALFLSGNRMGMYDVSCMLLYVFASAAFALFVGLLCYRREAVGTVLPLVIFVSAVLCPIFIDVGGPEALRVLMPTYLYLKAYGNATYLLYMVIYTLLFGGLAYPVFCIRTKK